MNDTEQHVAEALGNFAKMIEQAPSDDTEPNPFEPIGQQPDAPNYVKESHGWGAKYCRTIQLTGAEWHAALETAKPIIATGGIVAMIGPRGPGKTQMAAELARTGNWSSGRVETTKIDGGVLKHGKVALYRRSMDLFLDLRHAAKNHVKSSEREVLTQLADVGLLVIDEFQERGESEWENRIIKNLIDKRYASNRPTIIIANLTRAELFETLGDSIIDRARENGKSIEFTWGSFRGASKN